jgi:ribosomal protein L23
MTEIVDYTLTEITTLLEESREVSNELLSILSKVRIKVDKDSNPEAIKAIRAIFGVEFISEYR